VKTSGFRDTSEVPRDHSLLYHCQQCDGLIPSVPKDNVECACGNVIIDRDHHRLSVENFDKFEVVTIGNSPVH
jgi:hypothetical protein